jgi:hypothetical protein
MILDDLPSLSPLYDVEDANESSLPSELPSIPGLSSADHLSNPSLAGLRKEYHPSPSESSPGGLNLLQRIDVEDIFVDERERHDIHYPFASRADWQLANWLAASPLPQSEVNSFLRLDQVHHLFQNTITGPI